MVALVTHRPGCSARGYAATWGSLRPGTDAVEVHCANVQGCTIFSCVVRGSQKSCTAQTLVTLSVLVRSVLSINHRLASKDVSYEPAGPRGGAGLLFFWYRGGAGPRTRSARWWYAPDDDDDDDHHRRRRTKLVEPLLSRIDEAVDASKTPCPSRADSAEDIQTR